MRSLFPSRAGYLDVYDHYGLLGRRSVLAHGVHLTARERLRVHETGSAVAHCPTSNLFLGSGLFHVHQAKDPKQPMHVGLGTDIGAGTSFSLLQTMNEAYKVAELSSYPMDSLKSFYLATLGGARALDLDDRIGSLEVGKEADFVVLDPKATPLLEYRTQRAKTTEELMFVLSIMADDRAVAATYVAGQPAYRKEPGLMSCSGHAGYAPRHHVVLRRQAARPARAGPRRGRSGSSPRSSSSGCSRSRPATGSSRPTSRRTPA